MVPDSSWIKQFFTLPATSLPLVNSLVSEKSPIKPLIEGKNPKNYLVNTYKGFYDVELVDALSRYQKSRNNALGGDGDGTVSCPMPGKVVRVPVNVGDEVAKDDVVIVISAMKMESDYKAPKDGIVKEVLVGEGDTIESNQPLIIIE